MTEPTLFDDPPARVSDPETSHEAAAVMRASSGPIIQAIRGVLSDSVLPLSAFDIAERVELVHPHRWDEGSVRTAIVRSGIRAVDTEGKSPRGQRCIRYSL